MNKQNAFYTLFACAVIPLAGGADWSLRAAELAPVAPIERRLPPTGGVEIPQERQAAWTQALAELRERLDQVAAHELVPDAGIYLKAVEFAIRHGEFYKPEELAMADDALQQAGERIKELESKKRPSWTEKKGLLVRGYRSKIDESFQPYGLEIPEALDMNRPVPVLVWLHGRGDKTTDLHFIRQMASRSTALGGMVKAQEDAIIVHPFGRQCVGWKNAGEVDVLEVIEHLATQYKIDPSKITLAGFSMGGAGAWHVGAHHRGRFNAIHAGAGFAETKEYTRLKPENYPAAYVQTLWQMNDTPAYAWNLTNGPLIAYSGEKDRQKQAADLMERELKAIGHPIRHIIGVGMEHKYDQKSVDEIWAWAVDNWKQADGKPVTSIEWQTPTLQYSQYHWLQLTGLQEHWKSSRVTANWDEAKHTVVLQTANVTALELAPPAGGTWEGRAQLVINGEKLSVGSAGAEVWPIMLENGRWRAGRPEMGGKRPGMQGPLDDAFRSRFVVVGPTSESANAKLNRWVKFEQDHFTSRWASLMRGDALVREAAELTREEVQSSNLVLWGDPESNSVIARLLDQLPIEWSKGEFTFRGKTYPTSEYVPAFIFPNPFNPERYIVINSGLTFREAHDRTNSLQNPQLPDWAVIGLDVDPNEEGPGRIEAAGFFNERWQ